MHRAATAGKIFANDNVRPSPLNPTVRRLSVRLRTINNACEAPFSMPDGRPVTEVSLYGSRDRQLLIGPYSAVQRLMQGELPWDGRSEIETDLQGSAEKLQRELEHVDRFLVNPVQFNTEALIEVARRHWKEQNPRALWGHRQEEEIRSAAGFSLEMDRLDEIRTYSTEMRDVLRELTDMKKSITDSEWWWAWSPNLSGVQDRIESLALTYCEKRNALRPAAVPDKRLTRTMRVVCRSEVRDISFRD